MARLITIRCDACGHNAGWFENGQNTATCAECSGVQRIPELRIAQLGSSGKRLTTQQPLYIERKANYKNQYQKNPQPVTNPKFNMRLDDHTRTILNELIEQLDMTAADIIRQSIRDRFERHIREGGIADVRTATTIDAL